MSVTRTVNKVAVRRFLLERMELRTPPRVKSVKPSDVLQFIQKMECIQIDPVAAVERNQHLVLAARMPKYEPQMLEHLLQNGSVFEYFANAACVIPMADYPMFDVVRRRLTERLQPELTELGLVAEEVLRRLALEGPLPSKAFTSNERVHGYWDNVSPKTKATSHVLNLLHDTGQIHVVRREGTTRFFDVRERAVPKEYLDQAARITDAEAKSALLDKYMRAYRVFHLGDSRFGWQRMSAAERRDIVNKLVQQRRVVPLHIEGIKRQYFILSEDLEALDAHISEANATDAHARTARFLPPLDNLLWSRERLVDLFGFSYTWEVYTPAAKRQFGYYAMPILMGDRLIGRMDPRLDRAQARLDVELLQIEPGTRVTKALQQSLLRGLETFARFHKADLGHIARTEPQGILLE